MAGEKFTVDIVANLKGFLGKMAKATKAMKTMGDMNRGIIKNFQGMSSASKEFGQKFGQTRQKMKDGITNVDKAAKKSTSTFKKFFKVFAVGAGSIGLVATSLFALRKAFRSAALAAEIQVQSQAFANLTASFGENSQILLKELKVASRSTLNTMQIMTTASRAILLGISTDKLVDLMKIARVAAKAMGTTAAGAFSDIALGIGRQSRLILDNLGIIVKVGPAYEKYAKAIGTTAGALTAFERSQAFQNAVVEAGNNIRTRAETGMLDFQDRIAQLNVKVKEFGFLFGANILSVFETLVIFLEKSGLGKKFKEIFEVRLPKILISTTETLVGLLERLAPLLDKIDEKGIKQTSKEVAVDVGKSIGMGILDFLFLNDVKNLFINPFKAGFKNFKTNLGLDTSTDSTSTSTDTSTDTSKSKAGTGLLKDFNLAEELSKRLEKNLKGLTGGESTKSPMELARLGMESLNESLKDSSIAASDLQKQFSQTFPVIRKGIDSIRGSVTGVLSVDGSVIGGILANNVKQLDKEFRNLKETLEDTVRPEAFLESVGILSDERFAKKATQNIAKVTRLLEAFDKGVIGDPKRLIDAKNKILSLEQGVGFDALSETQRSDLEDINKRFEKIIPNDSIQRGLNQWVDDFKNTKDRLTRLGLSLANNLSSGLDNFFFNAITGKLTNLQEAFNSLFQSILRSMTKFLADRATTKFFELLGFGGTSKTATGSGGGLVGKVGAFFSKGSGSISATGGGPSQVPVASGFSKFLSSVRNVLPFAKGGITSLAGIGDSAQITSRPTLAAISEKGQSEAIVPLDKFASLIKPTNINITAIDTQSFAEFAQKNGDVIANAVLGVKGSPVIKGLSPFSMSPI